MWNFLRDHPCLTGSMCMAGCIPLADCYLKRKATKGLIRRVYAKMEVGSKPTIPLRSTVISRPEVLEKVKVVIVFPQRQPGVVSRDVDKDDFDEVKGFCVIVGPSGTGKTVCIRQICNESPKGALYVEIVDANSFMSKLSKEISMKTEPSSIIDLASGYLSSNYKLYHELSDDNDKKGYL